MQIQRPWSKWAVRALLVAAGVLGAAVIIGTILLALLGMADNGYLYRLMSQ